MSNLKKRIFTSLFLFIFIFLIFIFESFLIYGLIIIGTISCIEFFNIIKKIFKKNIYIWFINTSFFLFVFFYFTMIFLLQNFFQFKILIFIILMGCVASDIGGFIFGKYFQGPKLSKISPNKTISGALGSLIFTSFFTTLLFFYIFKIFNFKIILLSLIISIGCQIGDLSFSFIKRKAKIKDTGNFLPGHGGILDRIDGIFLGLPLGLVFFIIIF